MKQEISPLRYDYSFPLRIGSAHRQAELVSYAAHVGQMIRQVLLTSPGERVCMPEFGCGLRQLIFAPRTAGLEATTELMVRQALENYLSDHVSVRGVKVSEAPSYGDGALEITVEYTLLETQTAETVTLEVR